MDDLEKRLAKAVRHFWNTRELQGQNQGAATGDKDRGTRGTVTGGRHCDGFAHLIKELLIESGIPDAMVFHSGRKPELDAEPISCKSAREKVEVTR